MQDVSDPSRLFSTDLVAAGLGLLGLLLAAVLMPRLAQAQSPTPVTSIVNSNADTTLQVGYNGSLLMPGTVIDLVNAPNDSIPAECAGTRLMWYPAKAAFRAGRVGATKDGTQWDAPNVDSHSAAFGVDTEATGIGATATGFRTTASGDYATALGHNTSAATGQSVTMGQCSSANASPANSLFTVGNGSYSVGSYDSRSDALALGKDGDFGFSTSNLVAHLLGLGGLGAGLSRRRT